MAAFRRSSRKSFKQDKGAEAMECRIDAPQQNPFWGLKAAPAANAAVEPAITVAAPANTTAPRDQTPGDLHREFAERLTRISNLLGVLTHLVRVEDLPDDERQRFDASLHLAELEISQAGEMIRSNRRSSSRNHRNEAVRVDQVFRDAIDSFRMRCISEGIECDAALSQASVECDQLALRSMLFGLMKLATEAASQVRKGARLTARMLVDRNVVHIAVDASGPTCANVVSIGRDDSPIEASREALQRCEQLALVLGGNLSVSRMLGDAGFSIRFELPRTH